MARVVRDALGARFTPQMRTMTAAEPVLRGIQSIFNWCQDFEMCLSDALTERREELLRRCSE